MRVVTIERFGTLTPDTSEHPGCIYEGDGWLLRFVTQSPDHFFLAEIENLCHVLNDLDVRAIYELVLYGDGAGLYDVRMHISFEQPPENEQIDQLKFAASSAELRQFENDALDQRLLEFLRVASKTAKKLLANAIERETRNESETNQNE